MYSIGQCRECDIPVCGDHGQQIGESLLCSTHLEQGLAAQAAAARKQEDDWLAHCREEGERKRRQTRDEVPRRTEGFPDRVQSFAELSQALQRLVPGHARSFNTGSKKWFQEVTVEGWPFCVAREQVTFIGDDITKWRGIIVSTCGRGYHVGHLWGGDSRPSMSPSEVRWSDPLRPAALTEEVLTTIRVQVFDLLRDEKRDWVAVERDVKTLLTD